MYCETVVNRNAKPCIIHESFIALAYFPILPAVRSKSRSRHNYKQRQDPCRDVPQFVVGTGGGKRPVIVGESGTESLSVFMVTGHRGYPV